MTTDPEFDQIARAWLEEGPSELPDRVLESALNGVHQTRQRRRAGAPWRFNPMSSPTRLAAVAAVVVVASLAGLAVLGRMPASSVPNPAASSTAVPGSPVSPTRLPDTELGVLKPGEFSSASFWHPLTYRVPAGWQNTHDRPWQYSLVPTADALVGPFGTTVAVINVAADPVAATLNEQCQLVEQPGVGKTARDLAAWVGRASGVVATAPTAITIGGIEGVSIDVQLAGDWTNDCGPTIYPTLSQCDPSPCPADPVLGILRAPTSVPERSSSRGDGYRVQELGYFLRGSERERIIFLDVGTGTVAIFIDAFQAGAGAGGRFDPLLAAATPIVDSFRFGLEPGTTPPHPSLSHLVAFTSNRSGHEQIYVMNPDGSNVTPLTRGPSNSKMPTWSPDGTRIAFVSDRSGTDQIYTMRAEGENVVVSTVREQTATSFPAGGPAWSPDGSQIAFYDASANGTGIYTVGAGLFGPPKKLIDRGIMMRDPAWSPDGTRIAGIDVFGQTILVGDPDGAPSQRLLDLGQPGDFSRALSLAWSPDGKRLTFSQRGLTDRHVLVIDASGSNRTQLTGTGNPAGVSGLGDDYGPAWSPDESQIAFTRSLPDAETGVGDIFVMNADGSGLTQLTNDPANDWGPSWR